MNSPSTRISQLLVKYAGDAKPVKPKAPLPSAPAKTLDEVLRSKTVAAFKEEWSKINGSSGPAKPATKMPWEIKEPKMPATVATSK